MENEYSEKAENCIGRSEKKLGDGLACVAASFIGGIGLAALVGVILNLVLPRSKSK